MAVLADHLTVGETYFFREPRTFEILADTILPELIRQRRGDQRRLRIWSAACCTGEEPYSIAMVLHQAIPDLADWNITLLATDINPRFLRKAERGIFGSWSFRDTPAWIRQRYFRPAANGQFEILPEIKRLVQFANLNLVEDGYPSLANDTNAMDVIFCRNVLMYFTPAQATKVIHKLHRAEVEGGWLLVSATELSQVSFPQYAPVHFPDAILYRKQSGPVQRIIEPAPPPVPMACPPVALNAPARSEPIINEITQEPEHLSPPVLAEVDSQARSLANEGKLDQALDCCDRWIARDKLNAHAHYLRAVILQEHGRIDPAVRSLRAAVYLDANFVLAHFALGNIAHRRGQNLEADRYLTTALRLSARYRDDEVLPESDGITASRFAQMVHSLLQSEASA
jgi:chemotaxis protein methyltransferase CheR